MTPFHTLPNGDQMNYEPNAVLWKPGDLVLHDSDAKRRDMLMRVVNYAIDGRCRTEYLFDSPERRRTWKRGKRSTLLNPTAVLHDPARFGIDTKTITIVRHELASTRVQAQVQALAAFLVTHPVPEWSGHVGDVSEVPAALVLRAKISNGART